VLLITPRVIRNIERPGARIEEFNSGTELEIGRGGTGAAVSIPPVMVPPTGPRPSAPPEAPGLPEGPRPPAAGPAPKPQQQ
jgi:general secretion pathway protein D